jgi:putative ATP-dependent endonuclease of OLD family
MPEPVLRRFLNAVKDRSNFPQVGAVTDNLTAVQVQNLVQKVLEARKGNNCGYASQLIAQCNGGDELPATIRDILLAIHESLTPPPAPKPAEDSGAAAPIKPKPAAAEDGAEAGM